MSYASKIFLSSSILLSGGIVYGVHYLQTRESDVRMILALPHSRISASQSFPDVDESYADCAQTMYQGVLRDEERVRTKAQSLLSLPRTTPPSTSAPPPSTSTSELLASQAQSGQKYSTPLNTPSSPVQQPASVLNDECDSCIISPPPELLEAQSADERAREREERKAEYEAQRRLGDRLGREQGVQMDREV